METISNHMLTRNSTAYCLQKLNYYWARICLQKKLKNHSRKEPNSRPLDFMSHQFWKLQPPMQLQRKLMPQSVKSMPAIDMDTLPSLSSTTTTETSIFQISDNPVHHLSVRSFHSASENNIIRNFPTLYDT